MCKDPNVLVRVFNQSSNDFRGNTKDKLAILQPLLDFDCLFMESFIVCDEIVTCDCRLEIQG